MTTRRRSSLSDTDPVVEHRHAARFDATAPMGDERVGLR
jgi:hypothetical protein